MLRHPVDSPEWRNINREWPDCSDEIRNLRLQLCTDEINPYG
jgi:Transposase family tnp2